MSHPALLPVSRMSLAGALLLAACGGDETAPVEDHTPATYNLIVNDVPQTSPYALTAGQSRVQIKFFNAAGDDLDDVEAEHFGRLTFSPTSLATATRLADHHFQFDVTASNPGSGTLQVGFGHDDTADEKVFSPVNVNVTGGGGPLQ
ncbi:MAG TPA: hypothetical protein VK899_11830 [Gemmatimonadales bacterium]|nr:hypothetical protein [Gemmatimonadales bacterium]